MALTVYNVRTRQKEPFQPLDPKGRRVGLYLCGLTVYDHVHIGHARTAVSFEVIRRWLERSYDLRYVQNVTDVDDKIINRAAELGVSPRAHAAHWDAKSVEVLGRLGVRPPDETPHVTDSIDGIIEFIEAIIANGYAYPTSHGNVYFDVPGYDAFARGAFPQQGYGDFSRRDYREMAAGTRKDVEADKRHPADFALWKAAGADDHPDASWESPWGLGRPGWHIECSLMSTRSLGYPIDIHGGGQDLIFPHHENEIAQSQARFGSAPFVNVWLHTGFLNVEGVKMSKSLGNFIVLEELLDEMDGAGLDYAALRFYFVQTHYRSKIDFSRKGLDEAGKAVLRLQRLRQVLAQAASSGREADPGADAELTEATERLRAAFVEAMDDDFHTPGAAAALFVFQRACNQVLDARPVGAKAAGEALAALEECGGILTLFAKGAGEGLGGAADGVPDTVRALAQDLGVDLAEADSERAAVDALLAARAAARAEKRWKDSDAIRDALTAAGYLIEDTPHGARWTKAT